MANYCPSLQNTSRSQLTRILLACNRLIRNASNWRCHEQYLNALVCLNSCLPEDAICSSFVPMIKEEILNVRALPCRHAAVKAYVTWLICFKEPMNLRSGVEFFIKNLSAEKFLREHILSKALTLAEDKVFNVRYKLVKLISRLDNNYHSAIDHGAIAKAKLNLADLLSREKRPSTKRSGLVRSSITPNEDKQDRKENHMRKKSIIASETSAVRSKKENGKVSADLPVSTPAPKAKVSPVTSTTATEPKPPVAPPRSKIIPKTIGENSKLPPPSSGFSTFPRRTIGIKPLAEIKPLVAKKTTVQQRQLMQRSPSPRPLFRISSVIHKDNSGASQSDNSKPCYGQSNKSSNGSPNGKSSTSTSLPTKPPSQGKRNEGAAANNSGGRSYPCMKSSSLSSISRTPPGKTTGSGIRTGIVSRSVQKFERTAAMQIGPQRTMTMTSSLDRSATRAGSLGSSRNIKYVRLVLSYVFDVHHRCYSLSFGSLSTRRNFSTGDCGRSSASGRRF
ncbi:unnamed protein product [Soboliphyme baturini]|uniref:CLASP_N domain-containing protein n=1 Tax=Soboliphyme baturini TaxID=241478 RepID=A0A183J2L8_9BILA|nr:unnamed protein product [Soboliphyme baturini]